MTMVEINRVWLNVDTDTNKITLFSRPRVSIHVDEYIWSLIEEHIAKPHKLMRSEKHKYLLKIAFGRFDPVRHRYYPLSPYNGPLREGVKPDSANGWYPREDFAGSEERTTWFSPDKIWTNCGNKVLEVNVDAANVSESITPRAVSYTHLQDEIECFPDVFALIERDLRQCRFDSAAMKTVEALDGKL